MPHRLIKDDELCLYGPVGFMDFWADDGFSANEVLSALSEMSGDIVVRINSGGGVAFDGVAIYNALKARDTKITCRIDGIAASAASIIAMAGDEIIMPEGSLMMIHDASGITIGTATDHSKQAEVLNKLDGEMARIYAKRTGKDMDAVRAMMDEETWLDGDEALAAGFATKASEGKADEPTAFAYQIYHNAPERLVARAKLPGSHRAERSRLKLNPVAAAEPKGESQMDLKTLTLSGLREQRPDLVTEIEKSLDLTAAVKAATEAGAKAERERVAAIRAVLIPGHEAIIEAMCADPNKTEIDAHRAQNAAVRGLHTAQVDALKADEKKVEGLKSETTSSDLNAKKPGDGLEGEPKWKAEWDGSAKLQAEFRTQAEYIALMRAEANGIVRRLKNRSA